MLGAPLAELRDTVAMSPEQYNEVVSESVNALRLAADDDWSKHAWALDWTCRSTVDHIIDCVFSYAMQLAARADGGFLPFNELHATTEASNQELVDGLAAVARILHDLVVCAPDGTVASDGVVSMGPADWCARGAFEIALHTYDVILGLGHDWQLSDALCDAITSSPMLWMFDRSKVAGVSTGSAKLLAGSGRATAA
jgi:hypothetical protein